MQQMVKINVSVILGSIGKLLQAGQEKQTDRAKVLEEVNKILAEKLKPKPKQKTIITSGANASSETIKYKKKMGNRPSREDQSRNKY